MLQQVLKQIVYQASRLHQENPNCYGQKGSRPGTPGYVKDGFEMLFKMLHKNIIG